MHNRGDHGAPAAIIGMACRFPGAAEPAEFHDLTVAGRRMFRPVADGLRAALLDDWARPEAGSRDTGPVQKLAGGLGGAEPAATARAVAALFAAGAISDVRAAAGGTGTAASDADAAASDAGPAAPANGWTVPRMRDGDPTGPRTTVRSV